MKNTEHKNKQDRDAIDPGLERELKNIEAADDALVFITVAFLILLVLVFTLVFSG